MNESKLLQEIESLDKTINTKELFTRKLRESDWDTLVDWWSTWPEWTAPARGFLPENGSTDPPTAYCLSFLGGLPT